MSIFDPGKDVPDAPTWRCPHCRTLQPETSRCRACLRATVTCASCGHFRPTLVSGLGLCANDRTRAPLGSDEVHPCWVTAMAATRPGSGLLDDPVASVTGPAPAPSATATRRPHCPVRARLGVDHARGRARCRFAASDRGAPRSAARAPGATAHLGAATTIRPRTRLVRTPGSRGTPGCAPRSAR